MSNNNSTFHGVAMDMKLQERKHQNKELMNKNRSLKKIIDEFQLNESKVLEICKIE